MALLVWSQKYAVGVTTLDEHRKTFIEILNELHAAMLKEQGQSMAGSLLHKLRDHARNHHSTEEKILESAKYSVLAQQRERHREFTKRLGEFESRHQQSDEEAYAE